jgi:hypothetical protein
MRIKLSHLTPLLAAGAAAAAIASAPTAMAATNPAGPGCHMMGAVPVCPDTHSTLASAAPGNSQLNASPGPVVAGPQYPYWEGGYYGGYGGYGGYHGNGGFGGGFGGHGGFGGGGGGHGGHGR